MILNLVPTALEPVVIYVLARRGRVDGQTMLKEVEEYREGCGRAGDAVRSSSLAGVGFAAFGTVGFSLHACIE